MASYANALMPGESGGMVQDVSTQPVNDTMAQLELQRRLKMAQALQEQAMPEGQMVSGHYVAPSWTQNLANLANKYVGTQQEKQALSDYGQYEQGKQQKQAEALKKLGSVFDEKPITEQSTYDIQVPNGQAPQTENLGGMQPIQNGMKTIQVPVTNTTGMRKPTMNEIQQGVAQYGADIQNPALLEKLTMNRVENALKPTKNTWQTVGNLTFQLDENGNRTGQFVRNTKDETPGSLEKDYTFARQNGYNGSIEDFKRIPSSWINPYQQKELGLKEQADNPLGLPKPSKQSGTLFNNPSINNQDQQALAWANAHPNDPRAAKIKQRLGNQ